jgi:hypothetical protein
MLPSPKELDAQSIVKIDEWVDLGSERWRDTDDDPALTKQWVKLLMSEPAYLVADSYGRLWGKRKDGGYDPYHYNYGKKLIGIRLAKKAAN